MKATPVATVRAMRREGWYLVRVWGVQHFYAHATISGTRVVVHA